MCVVFVPLCSFGVEYLKCRIEKENLIIPFENYWQPFENYRQDIALSKLKSNHFQTQQTTASIDGCDLYKISFAAFQT